MIDKDDAARAANLPAVYFLHCMESGPNGSKSRALQAGIGGLNLF